MTSRRTILGALGTATLAGTARAQPAGAWPLRPLRMVIPYAPGTGPDTMARAFCDGLRQALGQPVTPDNRSGASGNIGAALVAHGPADGYTLLWGSNAMNAMNEFIFPNMSFNPAQDFAPVALCIVSSMVLAVRAEAGARDLEALVAEARTRPGRLAVAVTSATGQVALEMLRNAARIDLLPVPFAGSGQAVAALLGGDVQVLFDTLTASAGGIASGGIRALAVTPDRRIPTLPGVPTFVSRGYDVDVYPWGGIYVPRATPSEVVGQLNAAVNVTVRSPEVQRIVERVGSLAVGGSPADLAALEGRYRERFGPVIRRLRLSPN